MKRFFEIHYKVEGTATVSFDDNHHDTIDYEGVALDIFSGLPLEADEIDLGTLEVIDVEEIDGD